MDGSAARQSVYQPGLACTRTNEKLCRHPHPLVWAWFSSADAVCCVWMSSNLQPPWDAINHKWLVFPDRRATGKFPSEYSNRYFSTTFTCTRSSILLPYVIDNKLFERKMRRISPAKNTGCQTKWLHLLDTYFKEICWFPWQLNTK